MNSEPEQLDTEALSFAKALIGEIFGKTIFPVINRMADVVERSVNQVDVLEKRIESLQKVLNSRLTEHASSENFSRTEAEVQLRMSLVNQFVTLSWPELIAPAMASVFTALGTSLQKHARTDVIEDLRPALLALRGVVETIVRAGVVSGFSADLTQIINTAEKVG